MNTQRRKIIQAIAEKLEALRSQIGELKDEIDAICDQELDYFDIMPEAIQQSEKGRKAEKAVEDLKDAVVALETVDDEFAQAIFALASAEQ